MQNNLNALSIRGTLSRGFIAVLCSLACFHASGCSKKVEDTAFTKDPGIEWNAATRVKVAAPAGGSSYAGYARLTEIDDANLLCVYESAGSIWQTVSSNAGKTWQGAKIIAEKEPGINMAVPDILKLKNGNLLLMYNPRPYDIDPTRRFAIRIKISSDNGLTWKGMKEIYKAGYQFENGCWEPSAIQLPNETIQLYFANEGVYTTSDEQNISMLTSSDNGQTWSREPKVISFRPGKRDGMPVPVLLKGADRIAIAIEDNGYADFKPYIITNTLKENWETTVLATDANRIYALATPLKDEIYAGAPYLRQLSTGQAILSYQGTEGRNGHTLKDAVMKVAVGNNLANQFKGVTEPFVIPSGKNGLWNSIAVLKNDTVIALTSTNAFSNGAVEVWMIKGRLKK